MKYIRCFGVVFLLLLMVACSQTMSTVRVATLPSGGNIEVVETGAIVADGEEIQLPAGHYTLIPHEVANSPVQIAINVDGETPLDVMVPITPGMTRLKLKTVPAGATVILVELNRILNDGDSVEVPAGRYTFNAELAGYKPQPVVVETTGLGEEDVAISLGDGFGTLAVTVNPLTANVTLDDQPLGPLPVTQELTAGSYTLAVTAAGFKPLIKTVAVAPAEQLNLTLALEKIPTSATVELSTRPANGVLWLDGKKIGSGILQKKQVPIGRHQLTATKKVDPLTRLYGKTTVTVTAPATTAVVTMNQRQRLFAGKWFAEKTALAKEAQRFKRQKVGNPRSLKVKLTGQQLKVLFTDANTANLHATLRVGDALIVERGGQSIALVKRNATVTPAWQAAVQALLTGKRLNLPWQPTGKVVVAANAPSGLGDLLLQLHRSRNPFSLLDLEGSQLTGSGVVIKRNRADGALTLLASAGSKLTLNSQPLKQRGDFWYATVAQSDAVLKIGWQAAPAQLLVISDTMIPLAQPRLDKTLLLGEKKLITLTSAKVTQVERLTKEKKDKSWQQKILVAEGPLAAQMNLSVDEIGPHDKAGDYQRIWLVQINRGNATTQRQTTTRYQVTAQRKDNQSDRFLRRDKLSVK